MSLCVDTERLRLHSWREGDVDAFAEACNTPAVMQHLGEVQTRAQIEAAVARIAKCEAEHGHCFWVVERKSDDAFLGFCGLKQIDDRDAPMLDAFEIGWRLREDAWGQGYAREAATASLDLAFARFAAPEVFALTVAANSGSWRLMQRLGMARRSDLDFVAPDYPAHLNPTIVYSITEAQWTASA